MAALVCDLCGGKLVMGSGGIATCDSCGMEHSPERMREKVQEVKGVVQVDSSHLVENYMRMAQNAYDSGNKAEAENYCNKILETVPNHQQAWLLKGRAAGWQSTLGNIRFAEAINCFANAVANTEENEKESVIDACKQEVSELAEALIRLRGERFAKWPDEEEKNGFVGDLTVILQAILQFFKAVGTLINKDELMSPLATIINNSVIDAWNNVVRPTFANDHDGHPDDYELKKLIDRAGHCTDLLEQAVNLVDTDDEDDIKRYENLIAIHEYLINASSYSYETVALEGSFWNDYQTRYENQYVKSKSLTEEAKRQRRQLISKYQNKINSIKSATAARVAAEKAKNKKEFWDKHSEERTIINDAIARLKQERARLSSANTGFNQIKLIDATLQKLTEIQNKERSSGQVFSAQERTTISELTKLWDKLKNMEAEDAYFDKNPLLKEESAIRNKLKEDKESLRKAQAPADEHWPIRIIGSIALIGLFIYFYIPFSHDFTGLMHTGCAGNAIAGLLLSVVTLLGPTAVGAIACIFGPLKRLFANKKHIAQLKKSIQKSEDQLKQIEAIKADAHRKNSSFKSK